MEDPEVVAAIVAGDPAGLAEAYDRYAMPLYSYCRSILREPADAADAVQDTFLVATAKLRDLRDRARLRPWLYAVARNECLRRLRAGTALSALEEAADIPAETAEVGVAIERAEVLQLVRAAIDGLNPGERDVIELSLIQELDADELADALGVSRNHAHALLSRARGQLERSLGALIVARTGREACADLDAMLAGWDGQLTVLMRKRISRHIEQCEVCGERKRRELTPALFVGAVPMAAMLPGFREQVLRVLADRSPAGVAHRLTVANRAGPFGPQGFPKPISPPGASAVAPDPAPSAGHGGRCGRIGPGGRGHRGRRLRRPAPTAIRRPGGRVDAHRSGQQQEPGPGAWRPFRSQWQHWQQRQQRRERRRRAGPGAVGPRPAASRPPR